MLKKINKKNYYDSHTRESDLKTPYIFYIIRPLSFLIAPLFTLFRVSANAVTISRFFMSFILFYFIVSDNHQNDHLFFYAVLYHIIVILDFVDGNLARYYNSKSYIGKMFDGWVDSIIQIFLFVSIGFYLGDKSFMWSLIVSLIGLISVWTDQRFLYINGLKLIYSPSDDPQRLKTNDRNPLVNILKNIYTKFESIQTIYFSLIFIICAFFGTIYDWHYYGGFYIILLSSVNLIFTIYKSFRFFNVKYE
jgi:hypothetical protein